MSGPMSDLSLAFGDRLGAASPPQAATAHAMTAREARAPWVDQELHVDAAHSAPPRPATARIRQPAELDDHASTMQTMRQLWDDLLR